MIPCSPLTPPMPGQRVPVPGPGLRGKEEPEASHIPSAAPQGPGVLQPTHFMHVDLEEGDVWCSRLSGVLSERPMKATGGLDSTLGDPVGSLKPQAPIFTLPP